MATVYRPIDVLEKQVDLVRWWTSSQYRHGFIETFQDMINKYASMKNLDVPREIDKYLISRLDTAETFYVRSPIIARLWDFTDVYETHEHEVVLPQDLPCERGFFYLERPIHTLDARGRVTSIKAILWSEEREAVILSEFSDASDELDEISQMTFAQFGKQEAISICELPLMHIVPWRWGRKVQNLTDEDFSNPEELADFHGEAGDLETYKKFQGSYTFSVNRFNAFVISLWEFVQEQIPFRISADRPMLRRLKRAHSPLKDVTVIDLRPVDRPPQITDPDHVPQFVPWSHRWRVREHKRRWIDKHGNYRETTVSAHIKGPDHLQLIEKDRIFNVHK